MRHRFRARFLHEGGGEHAVGPEEERVLEIEPGELTRIFVAPPWLRDAGLVAWLLVGVVLVLVGAVWLLALTSTIVIPLIVAALIASVAGPGVAWLQRHSVPRAGGTALILLADHPHRRGDRRARDRRRHRARPATSRKHLQGATDKLANGLKDLGVKDSTREQRRERRARLASTPPASCCCTARSSGIEELAGLAVFAAFTTLSLFFLLKDGPRSATGSSATRACRRAVGDTILGQLARAHARLLRRRHDRRRVQRRRGRPRARSSSACRSPARSPSSRSSAATSRTSAPGRRRVRRADRARRRRAPTPPIAMAVVCLLAQRRAAADGPADRVRRHARHPPARGADRHDRAAAACSA